jgi:hypothetical protein
VKFVLLGNLFWDWKKKILAIFEFDFFE